MEMVADERSQVQSRHSDDWDRDGQPPPTIEDDPWFDPSDFDAPAPDEARLSFHDWIETQAASYRALDSDAAEWLAARIEGLAELAETLQAHTPRDFDAREEVLAGDSEARLCPDCRFARREERHLAAQARDKAQTQARWTQDRERHDAWKRKRDAVS